MPADFFFDRRIQFADTDLAGIVHFTRFFQFMEEAEHAFLRSRGLSVVMQHEGRSIGWPRVSARCDYLRPLRFEEVVQVRVRIARMGGKSIQYEFEFTKAGEVVARGELTACFCQVHGGQVTAIDLPDDLRRQIEGPAGS
jgi:4-hydroxybenzoyl-CoA thioesterase/acyl-CoA thioester hydrolase